MVRCQERITIPNKPAKKNDPFKGVKTGVWTRWGGGRRGLIHSCQDKWACQSCAEEQPAELPGFYIKHDSGEYLKVCAKCFALARKNAYSYERTIEIIRVWRD